MGNSFKTTFEPRVYVACLAAYNNGYLHGAWIDAAQEPWSIYDDVKAMLAASPIAGAEEWAIHDIEDFGGVRIEEYTGFERVSALASFIAEHGEIGAALLDYYSGDLEEAKEAIADRYMGEHSSLAEYVQELTEETTPIPQSLRFYIDWQGIARDAELNGELFGISTAHDVVHVFAGC
ncbi:MAG: antirestriction protein ArdA [Sphingomonadales bacterium]|nr:antirestriction protein ArdA [Sphingomonadales bacterium]